MPKLVIFLVTKIATDSTPSHV